MKLCLVTLLALVTLLPVTAQAWDRGSVERFASLPAGEAHPEGITADKDGNIYVTTFDVNRAGTAGEVGHLFVFRHDGRLLRTVRVQNSTPLLLDLAFQPTPPHSLLVIDFGGKQVLRVDPVTGMSTVFATIPSPANANAGLNVLTFDDVGNVYISDSFNGTIWKTSPAGGVATSWKSDPLLTTTGVPGFGANGLAFNKGETAMFVANTGNDTIVQIPATPSPTGPVAGTAKVFVNSINGADGLIIDEDDNIWVAANQADEIVVVDNTGRAIAKLGDFDGISHDGAAVGLLFPASLVRSRGFIYVTNLAIDLRLFDNPATPNLTNGSVDSQWAAQVTTYTVSRIRARIPGIRGLDD